MSKIKGKARYRIPMIATALLRKGGVHEKSKSAMRQADKRSLKKTVQKHLTKEQCEGQYDPPFILLYMQSF